MVRPLSRLGECGASALAGIVAGMVSSQKATTPMTINNSRTSSNRRMRRRLPECARARAHCLQHYNATPSRPDRDGVGKFGRGARSFFLLPRRRRPPIRLVAVAAGLADQRHGDLELVERLGLVLVVGHDLAERRDLGVEVALGFPDLRQSA